MSEPKLIAVTGATASGKSDFALRLAERVGGEIVSIDSMQIYRGIEIGTAQPSTEERLRVPHHLVGEFDFSERIDVRRFSTLADEAIRDIRSRGKLPILCGGSGFYLKSLLFALDELPADVALRANLDAEYDRDDAEAALHRRMNRLDPAALAQFGYSRRKLIRALEVHLLTGRSITELHTGTMKRRYDFHCILIQREREELKSRIARRARAMLNAGWIDEAEKAIRNGLLQGPTSHQALGYRIIGAFLQGNVSRNDLEERLSTATWQFARRQLTWFRTQAPTARKEVTR